MKNKTNKIARIIACLFIPILWPVRWCLKLYRAIIRKRNERVWPRRVEKAKRKAFERHHKTKRKQYAIRQGYRVYIYDRFDMRRANKFVRNAGLSGIDFRLLTLFTCENGRIIEK